MVLGISNTSSVKVNAADEEFVSKYETWDFEGSEEELTDYYIENDIRPASASPGIDVKIVAEDDGIPTYLSGRFPEYTSWMKSNNALGGGGFSKAFSFKLSGWLIPSFSINTGVDIGEMIGGAIGGGFGPGNSAVSAQNPSLAYAGNY